MGKLNYDQCIQHFSHKHPLVLSNVQETTLKWYECSGCKVKPSEWFYTCKLCDYFLHIPCSQVPQRIQHPAHPNHDLTLSLVPLYQTLCNACGEQVKGTGFFYQCCDCRLMLHVLCASVPTSVKHQTHSHPLKLTFNPPYQTVGFSCDICRKLGSNHWLYRCNSCGFDAHLHCAAPKPRISEVSHQVMSSQPQTPVEQQSSSQGSSHPQFQPSGSAGQPVDGPSTSFMQTFQPAQFTSAAIQGSDEGAAQQFVQSRARANCGSGAC
ncbi:hypothetical protein IFM89_007744 [Coptis chinensis]|uniref:Zinc finger PHD-type domain-containing protein n=1 Tax=Coptis chinensis TaxID=261450 RepID=A0A835ITX9_9MAGN|nr:hypothetical protein IFM89_007744 [Coptis chinensis]